MAPKIRTVLFDFMGTCLDWHTSIVNASPSKMQAHEKSAFACELRQAYFDYNDQRREKGQRVEDFDTTQRKVLTVLLDDRPGDKRFFSDQDRDRLVQAWHAQQAWPDVAAAIQALKAQGREVIVHANGSTRLQLDLAKSAGLHFDLMLSSELLGVYKPATESYTKVLRILQREPEEVVMVACHAYDLRGARTAGIRTVYVCRWTDDIREDQDVVRGENDAYLADMSELGDVVAGFED